MNAPTALISDLQLRNELSCSCAMSLPPSCSRGGRRRCLPSVVSQFPSLACCSIDYQVEESVLACIDPSYALEQCVLALSYYLELAADLQCTDVVLQSELSCTSLIRLLTWAGELELS